MFLVNISKQSFYLLSMVYNWALVILIIDIYIYIYFNKIFIIDTSYSYDFIYICIFAVTKIETVNHNIFNVIFSIQISKLEYKDLNNFSLSILILTFYIFI